MNLSADEETLSAAEVSKTNQVTVATVTTTSTTNTQTVYCMNDHANHVARRAYEKGWISRARVKKIFHRGLDDALEDFRDGCLPPLYLNNMINYGKFYQYLSRS